MNEIPFPVAQPFLDLGNPTDGRTGISLVTLDFGHPLEILDDVRSVSHRDRIPHDQDLGQVACPQGNEGKGREQDR